MFGFLDTLLFLQNLSTKLPTYLLHPQSRLHVPHFPLKVSSYSTAQEIPCVYGTPNIIIMFNGRYPYQVKFSPTILTLVS
jgi:hypothetical protein